MAPSPEKPPSPTTNAKIRDLQQPEKLSKILKEDQYDCVSCKVTGATTFIGIGGYIWFSGKRQLAERSHLIAKRSGTLGGLRARVAGTAVLASTFVGMGLYRLVN